MNARLHFPIGHRYEGTMSVRDVNAHGFEECFEFSPAIALRDVTDEDVRAVAASPRELIGANICNTPNLSARG